MYKYIFKNTYIHTFKADKHRLTSSLVFPGADCATYFATLVIDDYKKNFTSNSNITETLIIEVQLNQNVYLCIHVFMRMSIHIYTYLSICIYEKL
jgi:hypothetical protein